MPEIGPPKSLVGEFSSGNETQDKTRLLVSFLAMQKSALLKSKINLGHNGSMSMLYHLLKAYLQVEENQSRPEWEYEYALLL